MILRIVSMLLGLAGLAWLALLFSSRAILVSEKIEQGTFRQKLVCTYFAGSRNIVKEYGYSKSDTFGHAVCPRWEQVRPAAQ